MVTIHPSIYVSVFLILISLGINACKDTSNPPIVIVGAEKTSTEIQANTIASLTIDGMVCAIGCAKVIENELNELNGVSSAEVNFETKMASISFDSMLVEIPDFIKTVEELEFRFKVVDWNHTQ